MAHDPGKLHTTMPGSAAAPAACMAWTLQPDDLAYATWLKWGLLGEERALDLLQADLLRLGVIGRDMSLTAATYEPTSPFESERAGWTPFATSLVAAGAWLLADRRGSPVRQDIARWAGRVLGRAQARAAAQAPATADAGVPMTLACEMVQAQALLLEMHSPVTDMRARVLLGSIMGHPGFSTMRLPWRQSAWRIAEALHRRAGRLDQARDYRQLLARNGRDAEALIAQVSLRGLAGVTI